MSMTTSNKIAIFSAVGCMVVTLALFVIISSNQSSHSLRSSDHDKDVVVRSSEFERNLSALVTTYNTNLITRNADFERRMAALIVKYNNDRQIVEAGKQTINIIEAESKNGK